MEKPNSPIQKKEDLDVSCLKFSGQDFSNPILSQLLEGRRLNTSQIKRLCRKAKEHYDNFPNIIELQAPVCIIGDLHGQDEDLMTIFKLVGMPSYDNQFLLLGDYINRGNNSLRVILLMFALSIEYKSSFFCLRGNHESVDIAKIYGFYDECINKFGVIEGEDMFSEIMNCCNYLPLCAIINKKLFCCHGGLGPKVRNVKDIEKLERRRTLPVEGVLSSLVWSDPYDGKGYYVSNRGAGYYFGEDRTKRFLKKHKFDRIIRAHQMMKDGYGFTHNNQCITVFSASNYVYKHKNKGAILVIDKTGDCEFLQYYANYAKNSDDGDEIDVKNISKVKLNMNVKKKRKRYMAKLKQFKSIKEKSLRKEIFNALAENPLSALTKIPKKASPKKEDPEYDRKITEQEWEEEKEFNIMKKKLKVSSKDKEEKINVSSESVKMKKQWAKQYLYDFENSIKSEMQKTQQKNLIGKKDTRISDLENALLDTNKKLEEEIKNNFEKEIMLEKLSKRLLEYEKRPSQEVKIEHKDEEEKHTILQNLLTDTKEKEVSSLKNRLTMEKRKTKDLKKQIYLLNIKFSKEKEKRKSSETNFRFKFKFKNPPKKSKQKKFIKRSSVEDIKNAHKHVVISSDEDEDENENIDVDSEEDEPTQVFFHFNKFSNNVIT